MTDKIGDIEQKIALRVQTIAPWPGFSVEIPEGAIDAVIEGIAYAVAQAEGLGSGDAAALAQAMKREFKGQLDELTEIANEFQSMPASHAYQFARNIPFPDEEIETALTDLATASLMTPDELEIEALKRGIAALKAELLPGEDDATQL